MVEPNVGAARKRVEDPRLLRGEGAYVDDLREEGCLHAVFVRSPYPHARIRGIDAAAARAVPGVVGVFTSADIPVGCRRRMRAVPEVARRCRDCPWRPTPSASSASRVAVVVAESRYAAEDGAALVDVDYDPLPGVGHPEAALKPDAPQLHADVPGNVSSRVHRVWGDVDGAFARAAHRVSVRAEHHRIHGVPMEPRGLLVCPDRRRRPDGLGLHPGAAPASAGAGGRPRPGRKSASGSIAPDVGGGFGLKGSMYRDDLVTADPRPEARPARQVGRHQDRGHADHPARPRADRRGRGRPRRRRPDPGAARPHDRQPRAPTSTAATAARSCGSATSGPAPTGSRRWRPRRSPSSPTPTRSAPIVGPAARRPPSSPSASSARPPASSASTRPRSAAATSSSRTSSRTRRRAAPRTTAATTRACSTPPWSWPTTTPCSASATSAGHAARSSASA